MRSVNDMGQFAFDRYKPKRPQSQMPVSQALTCLGLGPPGQALDRRIHRNDAKLNLSGISMPILETSAP